MSRKRFNKDGSCIATNGNEDNEQQSPPPPNTTTNTMMLNNNVINNKTIFQNIDTTIPKQDSNFYKDNDNEKVILITKQYLTTVGICYPFFALGLGLYFVCQAFNTLLWPVLGTFLRLVIIIILCSLLEYNEALTYQNTLLVFAFSIIVYGVFIASCLHFGPWKKISKY